ncbi:hypothetical protein [Brevibacterium litoralis]|uniref:hypothetical protein n=1 Tax=Brevibacterium litoralis TaxID=3138935 RepID=UPI0032F00EFD
MKDNDSVTPTSPQAFSSDPTPANHPDSFLDATREVVHQSLLVTTLLALIAGFYLLVGHLACPPHERRPLQGASAADLWHTVGRGWFTVGEWYGTHRM